MHVILNDFFLLQHGRTAKNWIEGMLVVIFGYTCTKIATNI